MARNPKQDANLKPIRKGDLSKEELKKRQSNGGKKSAEVRRAQRDARSAARYILGLAATGKIKANLQELGIKETDELTNINAAQARLFVLMMNGNLEAYKLLMKSAGYDPEEIRAERESLASDRRRDMEVEAKVNALGGDVSGARMAVNTTDENGANDVVIYLPAIEDEKSCELPPEDETEGEPGQGPDGAGV